MNSLSALPVNTLVNQKSGTPAVLVEPSREGIAISKAQPTEQQSISNNPFQSKTNRPSVNDQVNKNYNYMTLIRLI